MRLIWQNKDEISLIMLTTTMQCPSVGAPGFELELIWRTQRQPPPAVRWGSRATPARVNLRHIRGESPGDAYEVAGEFARQSHRLVRRNRLRKRMSFLTPFH
jgi:hypothetical protein